MPTTLSIRWTFDFGTLPEMAEFNKVLNHLLKNPEKCNIPKEYFTQEEWDMIGYVYELTQRKRAYCNSFFFLEGLDDTSVWLTVIDKLKHHPRPAGFTKNGFSVSGEKAIGEIYDSVSHFLNAVR